MVILQTPGFRYRSAKTYATSKQRTDRQTDRQSVLKEMMKAMTDFWLGNNNDNLHHHPHTHHLYAINSNNLVSDISGHFQMHTHTRVCLLRY